MNQRNEDAPDASTDQRPGHPRERTPEPVASAHWIAPERQQPRADVLKDPDHSELTPTFGTEHPPRGISGLLRRAAYTQPDYRARRWLLLILADRVDSAEARWIGALKHPATWLVAAAAGGAWLYLRQSRPRPWFAR